MAGKNINLSISLPKGISKVSIDLDDFTNPKRLNLFYKFLNDDATVIAMYAGDPRSKNKTHKLAQALAGKFSSIEEVEGKDLFMFLNNFQKAKTVNACFLLALEFAKKCFTGVDKTLTAGTKRGEVTNETKTTKHIVILNAANCYLDNPSSKNLRNFFLQIRDNFETHTSTGFT